MTPIVEPLAALLHQAGVVALVDVVEQRFRADSHAAVQQQCCSSASAAAGALSSPSARRHAKPGEASASASIAGSAATNSASSGPSTAAFVRATFNSARCHSAMGRA